MTAAHKAYTQDIFKCLISVCALGWKTYANVLLYMKKGNQKETHSE